jgi:hypothetical protein
MSPKCFIGVKSEIGKIFSSCPKLLINAKLHGLVLVPRMKKGYHQIWEVDVQPRGPNNNPKLIKVGPKFFSPDPCCKAGLSHLSKN